MKQEDSVGGEYQNCTRCTKLAQNIRASFFCKKIFPRRKPLNWALKVKRENLDKSLKTYTSHVRDIASFIHDFYRYSETRQFRFQFYLRDRHDELLLCTDLMYTRVSRVPSGSSRIFGLPRTPGTHIERGDRRGGMARSPEPLPYLCNLSQRT